MLILSSCLFDEILRNRLVLSIEVPKPSMTATSFILSFLRRAFPNQIRNNHALEWFRSHFAQIFGNPEHNDSIGEFATMSQYIDWESRSPDSLFSFEIIRTQTDCPNKRHDIFERVSKCFVAVTNENCSGKKNLQDIFDSSLDIGVKYCACNREIFHGSCGNIVKHVRLVPELPQILILDFSVEDGIAAKISPSVAIDTVLVFDETCYHFVGAAFQSSNHFRSVLKWGADYFKYDDLNGNFEDVQKVSSTMFRGATLGSLWFVREMT